MVEFQSIVFNDKKGRKIRIRGVEISDAADLIEFMKVTNGETPFLLREPEEITLTLEEEKRFLENRINSGNEFMLVAESEFRLVSEPAAMLEIESDLAAKSEIESDLAAKSEIESESASDVKAEAAISNNVDKTDWKLVGACSLMNLGPVKRYDHRCGIAIALLLEYCSAGIGEQMLTALLGLAKERGYEQVELEVVEGNDRAKSLYEKLGFIQYGVFPDNMKYKDGSYRDSYWMMKKL